MKLNLGCGKDIKQEYVNLDIIKNKGVDIVHDLNKFPYPFKDNTFSEIICKNILEHLDNVIKVLEELYRISKPHSKIKIQVPFFLVGIFLQIQHTNMPLQLILFSILKRITN